MRQYICAGWACGWTGATLAAVLAHQRKARHGSGRYYTQPGEAGQKEDTMATLIVEGIIARRLASGEWPPEYFVLAWPDKQAANNRMAFAERRKGPPTNMAVLSEAHRQEEVARLARAQEIGQRWREEGAGR